jgi:hypothetical protein
MNICWGGACLAWRLTSACGINHVATRGTPRPRCSLLGSHGGGLGEGRGVGGCGMAARYGKWSMPNSSSLQTAFELYDRAQAEALAGEFRAFCKYASPPSLLTEAVCCCFRLAPVIRRAPHLPSCIPVGHT